MWWAGEIKEAFMIHLNYLAIVVAAVAVFVFAAGYYIALARQRAKLSSAAAASGSRPRPLLMGLELLKSLTVAAVVAWLVALAGISDVAGALKLALALWIAFPAVLLVGSVTQERAMETRRDPCRRLAGEATHHQCHRHLLALKAFRVRCMEG